MSILVRAERAGDSDAIHRVNHLAFEQAFEANLVDRLRAAGACKISLVATCPDDNSIVGHILFTEVVIAGAKNAGVVGLAPMAVLPERQREGIGSRLVEAGLAACRDYGYRLVVVVGHPEYYPRFGFRPAHELGLKYEVEIPPEAFMARELVDGGAPAAGGVVSYHPAFSES